MYCFWFLSRVEIIDNPIKPTIHITNENIENEDI
jgi:hypothetical protein